MQRTKHAARVAAALAALVLLAPGAARAAIDDGLVASYTFDDGTARDVSGNGNDGTAWGDVTYADGWSGLAVKLGGVWSRGYLTAPPSPSLTFATTQVGDATYVDEYTFALWFNVESFAAMNGYGQPVEINGLHALFAKAGDRNGIDLRAQRVEGEPGMRLWAFDGWCCGGGAAIATEPIVGIGEWHHAAVTSGGGFVRLYLDGVEAGTPLPVEVFAVNPQMQAMPLQLGIDQDATWYPLDGLLDEVRVYRRALAADEIAVLANRDLVPPEIALATPWEGQIFLLNEPVLAEWSATDAGAVASGVCSASGTVASGDPLDTTTVGAHGFTVDAADCAGNRASASTQYWVQYAFGGFLPPLHSDRSTLVRAGNNVTVKFQLADAAGALVTTAAPTLWYAEVVDAAGGTLGPGFVPPDGGVFRYDALSGQYVYNFSTRALTVGKLYELDVELGDGVTATALLEIR